MHLGLVGASGAQFEPWEWGQGHQLKQAWKIETRVNPSYTPKPWSTSDPDLPTSTAEVHTIPKRKSLCPALKLKRPNDMTHNQHIDR